MGKTSNSYLTSPTIQICLCDAEFEAAHELVRCKARCGKLYHPGCLGLADAEKVEEWEGEGGKCGYCADNWRCLDGDK